MSTLSTVKAVLQADATLASAATGGIYDDGEAGRLGLNRSTTPAAFDDKGRIKPCILLKVRSTAPAGIDHDQYTAVREVLEVWFYEDRGYATIETMRDRVFSLLHAQQLANTFGVLWQSDVRGGRDIELDACVERSEYAIFSKRQ